MKYNYHSVQRRCLACGFAAWENTSSNYLRDIGRLKELYGRITYVDEDIIIALLDELNSLYDELDNSYWNIPGNLIESCLGNKIDTRRANIGEVIEALRMMTKPYEFVTLDKIMVLLKAE